jgi:hypothetical protein
MSRQNSKRGISRRTLLRGIGTTLALPLLDAMAPSVLLADGVKKRAPNRMAFLYVPNGKHMPDWTPTIAGSDYQMPWTLEPLGAFRNELTVITGLAQDGARPHQDGPGDHARALASFLTGKHPRKTNGADIRAGVSVDQVAAAKVGQQTKFASLELGCEQGSQAGNCDSGYSCAYSTNISWRSETTPAVKEINPRLVFERLFCGGPAGANAESRALRDRYQKSILDFVLEDAHRLRGRLDNKDKQKLDEYLSSVREIERRVSRNDEPSELPAGFAKPAGIPKNYGEHIRLMCDLMALAFSADLTRVATFVLADEGSNRSYRFLDVPEGHHELSHHGGDPAKHAKLRKINRFHVEQLAYFLGKLKSMPEGEGSLLDHSMIVYGSGISDGNRHGHDNLPVLLAGKAGGTIKTGHHLKLSGETPMNNLYLSMLDRVDSPTETFGDSTGRLTAIDA